MRGWLTKRGLRSGTYSISDPRVAALFGGWGAPNYSGVEINESTALALSAVFRAAALISGTVASLPMPTFKERAGVRSQAPSFLDDPGGPLAATPFEWKETVLLHLVLHGNAFLRIHRDGFGAVIALEPIHPLSVSVRWRRPEETDVIGPKVFTATMIDGRSMNFDTTGMIHIPYMSVDGLRGLSPIAMARNSLGTAAAGDRAAAKMFNSGALMSGVLTPAEGEDVNDTEAKTIKAEVTRNAGGWENASDIAVINRRMTFTSWSISAEDLQFIASRQFQIEEIARWFGVPPHLLMQTEKQTSWGQGVESQNRAMGRTVLLPWTQRIEQRLSRLLPDRRWVEFDFAELERPTPEAEIGLLIQQTNAGLLTLDEARHRLNLGPIPGGDIVRIGGQPLVTEAAPAAPAQPALSPAPPADVDPATADIDQALSALSVVGRADPPVHTGAMVALLPSAADAARLAVDGGEPLDELHLTLMYLGDAAAIPAEAQALLVDQVERLVGGPVDADGFAVSMFNPTGPEPCIVLGVSGQSLDAIHGPVAAGVAEWAEACAVDVPAQHAPWIPHVTLQYSADVGQVAALVDRVGPITFDRIRVVFAGDATDIPLRTKVPA